MPALKRTVKAVCRNCGTSVTKKQLSRHKSRCHGETLYCTKCSNFSTKSADDSNYHIAKKHSAAGLTINHTCQECIPELPNFYSLRHHKQRYHTTETTSSGEKAEMQSIADPGDDRSLEEEL